MERLYLWLDLGSLALPLIFSFHPKIKFYKLWPSVLPGIAAMAMVFIPWDIYFTANGFWGFNPDYLTGIEWFGLPMEEWLFFFCIPYACLFTHHVLSSLIQWWPLNQKRTNWVYVLLVTALVIALNAYLTIEPQSKLNNTGKLAMLPHNGPRIVMCQFVQHSIACYSYYPAWKLQQPLLMQTCTQHASLQWHRSRELCLVLALQH